MSAVLEAANQQRQALLERVGQIFTAVGHTASPDLLLNSLPDFIYDPDNGCTFDVWFNRCENVIAKDGSTLYKAARARLIVPNFDAAAYSRFTNHILLKRASKVGFDDTTNTSVFASRYAYLRTQRNGESLSDFTGIVNRQHEMAEFNAITLEQMKCLVWIYGLHTIKDADIRTRAIRKIDGSPQATLEELSLEIQQFLNIKQDVKLLGSPPSLLQREVIAVATKKNRSHWAKDCYFINKTCHNCKLVGHKKGYCNNFANKKKRNLKKHRTTNNVVVIASAGTDVAPVNRIYGKVQINGATLQMRLDTGADVTLLSVIRWIKISRPKLLPPPVKLKSANNKDIKVRGYFECNFDIDGHRRKGNCHVADTQSLLVDWIIQNKPSFRHVTEGTICKVSATATAKDPIKAELNSWPKPTAVWNRVHADFAGPIDGTYYLVVVDAYSKWPKIVHINSVSTSATTSALKKIFAQFGNPQTLVTENGTQFASTLFKEFRRARGITHVHSPSFHPQNNG
ncbi:unnamed protein product [Toxocara canis]|uniref:Integrase catalytic domain-containing protein n=1 Tax=Toxocara canis TaxID=6265 RepID=A0A183UTP9_TOXCA|nr:unnamed protein product [Toxocara canis]